jgi:hypothetical protein
MSLTRKTRRLVLVVTLIVVGVLYVLMLLAIGSAVVQKFVPARMPDTIKQLDYARFWYVGERLLLALHGQAQAPVSLSQQFPTDLLSTAQAPLKIWLYPPTMNLLAMGFAQLPLLPSFWVWELASTLFSLWLLRRAGLPWAAIILGLICTANLNNLYGGQSGALLGSVLVACLLVFDKHPRAAGILAGCLSLKPQLGLALIVILPQRARHVLPWAMLTSILVQGASTWVWFFRVAAPMGTRIISGPLRDAIPQTSFSVFMTARSFGVSVPHAYALQVFTAFISFVLIAAAWRRPIGSSVRLMAFTVCLTTLITPYGFIYDLTGFGIAMAAMFLNVDDLQKAVFGVLWLMSGYSVPVMLMSGHVIFPFCAVLGAVLCQPFTSRYESRAAPPQLYAAGR